MKLRLSATVVFSSVIGYLLGTDSVSFFEITYLIIGGVFVTGSANSFNQILEKSHDKLMQRTSQRPLPLGKLSSFQAIVFSVFIGVFGLFILSHIFPGGYKSCLFALLSMLVYVLAYTPLKRISPLAIFVGAFPGAIPVLLGWVAATNDFGLSAGILFAVQFCWQFPHFIAISWVLDEQYKKAGFKMIYGGEKGKYPAGIALMTLIIMTIFSTLPFFCNFKHLSLSVYALFLLLILGIWFALKSIKLYQNCDDITAKQLMLSSFAYLPLMQIIYILDKFLIQ